MDNSKKMTAVCGIYCAECECHKAKDSEVLFKYLVNAGIKAESLPCPGCREGKGKCPPIKDECLTYNCAQSKNVDFCFECAEFPCEKLNPSADRATVLPHNLKVYNLCYIKNQGIEKFAEDAAAIKNRYFKGKMAIGKGPQVE